MDFILYPAIDVRAGGVVRLRQGDYADETRYGEAPLGLAQRYAAEGAQWLHLVDLDAAKSGRNTLLPVIEAIHASTALRVQTGGGVRDEADLSALLEAGAERVVVGTLAVRQPSRVMAWLHRFGVERVTVALDTRIDATGIYRLPVQGWTDHSGLALFELLEQYAKAGLRHLLCTDINRDGMLCGLNLELYREIATRFPAIAVQASGGVGTLEDLGAAREVGSAGVILGKALLEGRFGLADAVVSLAAGEPV